MFIFKLTGQENNVPLLCDYACIIKSGNAV